MKQLLVLLPLLTCLGCAGPSTSPTNQTLPEARKGFTTKARGGQAGEAVAVPPPNIFEVVRYDAPTGQLVAYLTPNPRDGKKRPAIIWITGGDCNTIGDVWSPAPAKDDQTAAQYRQAGIVMLFPSLRGGNQNPGQREGFFGEVDDVLAAADFLARQEHVDPQRIYLGGHSTGGTLVLLVAASTNRFRGVFSFGPVDSVAGYPREFVPVDLNDNREVKFRSPVFWMHSIQCPTFIFEGDGEGNLNSLRSLKNVSTNPLVQTHPVAGHDHFSLLAPLNRTIAKKILADTGEKINLTFTQADLAGR